MICHSKRRKVGRVGRPGGVGKSKFDQTSASLLGITNTDNFGQSEGRRVAVREGRVASTRSGRRRDCSSVIILVSCFLLSLSFLASVQSDASTLDENLERPLGAGSTKINPQNPDLANQVQADSKPTQVHIIAPNEREDANQAAQPKSPSLSNSNERSMLDIPTTRKPSQQAQTVEPSGRSKAEANLESVPESAPKTQIPTSSTKNITQTGRPVEPEAPKSAPVIDGDDKRARSSGKSNNQFRRASDLKQLTETEILPFSYFNVQQPAFSDLIKIWPPTTQHQLRQYQSTKPNQQQRQSTISKNKPQNQHQPHSQQQHSKGANKANNNNQAWSFFSSFASDPSADLHQQQRNNLNEDLDDTIVTADQSFESDQLLEPVPYVNYLGEVGDFIYAQLKRLFDRQLQQQQQQGDSSTNQTSASNTGAPSASGQATSNLRAILEELLDDHYYQQYENSQVLYYGPQLAREGDIVEIGCFMPNDQASEWTKSALSIVQGPGATPTSKANQPESQPQENKNNIVVEVGQLGGAGQLLPRLIKRTDFLGAKLNFSLKIFEAQVSDSGNYRCNRMSRKYHKLLVVPQRISQAQLYLIQQRLLSIVNPKAAVENHSDSQNQFANYVQPPHILSALRASLAPNSGPMSPKSQPSGAPKFRRPQGNAGQGPSALGSASIMRDRRNDLLPSVLIIEHEPLLINCNITDEFVLRKLRDNEQFQLSWYKNGKLLRQSLQNQQSTSNHHQSNQSPAAGANQIRRPFSSSNNTNRHNQQHPHLHQDHQAKVFAPSNQTSSQERLQILQPNGRQLLITSAQYSDAGDYLCSWSKLLSGQLNSRQRNSGSSGMIVASSSSNGDESTSQDAGDQALAQNPAPNPLAAGHLIQLSAPTRLRPFGRSVFHVREGSELRLACMAQGGYPAPLINWYIGNRLVDEEFLRQNEGEIKILQLQSSSPSQVVALGTSDANRSSQAEKSSSESASKIGTGQIIEINPIPFGNNAPDSQQNRARHRGQQQQPAAAPLNWVDYRDSSDERLALDSREQQLRYVQFKMAQLTSAGSSNPALPFPLLPGNPAIADQFSGAPSSSGGGGGANQQQPANLVSVLVVSRLDVERHSARVACRAVTRANTDEVTTVIKVLTSSTITVQPSTGRATLIYGQTLHLECGLVGQEKAEFKWFKRAQDSESASEEPLVPDDDNIYQIHNERLKLIKPTYDMAGDYICRPLLASDNKLEPDQKEFAVIKVRAQPYIEDFGVELSHTGKSAILTDGDRLEIICKVDKLFGPVNITWYRSQSADNDSAMVELDSNASQSSKQSHDLSNGSSSNNFIPSTYQAPNDNLVMIEEIDSHTKKLVINSVKQDHRGYYTCLANNGVTERTKKFVYLRVKDKLVALWPFLGIVAEIFILLTIIQIWETQRAYKEVNSGPATQTPHKRPCVVVPSSPETVPLTSA